VNPDLIAFRSVPACDEDPILFLAGHVAPGPLNVPVEKTGHFRREQHFRAAARRLPNRFRQSLGICGGVDSGP
jgi:hypothetical protein